ncbi:hypothetical protein ABWH96_20210 [Marivirga tractuosa]|uniref:hypothetical protein n=1 Tax=Marivirga tractuosa TaxID=1006 RepID=UPI0035CFB574
MVRQQFIYFLISNFLFISFFGFAQKQVDSVVKLSESINSSAEEIQPLLSLSGDSLFFARFFHEENIGGKYSGSDIWLSIFDEGTQEWGKASNQLKNWNDKRNNFIVGINPKEKIIYLNNPKNPDKGIQFVKKIGNYWTKPENISLPGIPKSGYQGLYVSPDYSVIILAMKTENGFGKEDLYISTKNDQGDWTKPVSLGSTINTSESEISPFLSADKQTLYFASKGHGGYGDMDIFKSERLYDSWNVWSKPINLGDKINSPAFDGYYSQHGDSLAFFSSNREGELSDVYEVRFISPKKFIDSNKTINISSAQQKADRIYLNEDKLSTEYSIPSNFMIEVALTESINGNNLIEEQLWFLAGRLNQYPNLKVAFKIVPIDNISSDILVIRSNKIIAELFSELILQGVNRSKLEYDGIEISNKESQGRNQKVRIIPLFFKE